MSFLKLLQGELAPKVYRLPFDIYGLMNQSWFDHLAMHHILVVGGGAGGFWVFMKQRVPGRSLVENLVGVNNVQILVESSDAALQAANNQR